VLLPAVPHPPSLPISLIHEMGFVSGIKDMQRFYLCFFMYVVFFAFYFIFGGGEVGLHYELVDRVETNGFLSP
jgi:hypothetical protein